MLNHDKAAPNPPRLLVVEDDEALVELLSYNLNAAGFEVIATDDGVAALDLLEREPVAALVVDWSMPKLSGIEICRRLRRHPALRQVPVLMLTGKGGEDDRRYGLASGASAFMTKPCNMQELAAQLRRMIGARGQPAAGYFSEA